MADILLRFRGDSSGAVRASAQTSAAIGGVGKSGRDAGAILRKTFIVGGALVAAGLGLATKKAMDFEAILSQVEAVSGATASEMEALEKAALDLGASTKFSATEVAAAEVELGKAGLSASQILGGALKGSLSLAAAGNLELADAASFAANAMNLFGLEGKDVTKVADAFATAANQTTADVSDFGAALTQGGAAAKAAGLSFNDAMVILEALAKAGVKNSDAGTSMKTALLQLINPTKKQAAAAKEYGINLIDANGRMKDAADISKELRDATEGMTKAERLKLFATLAGTDGVRTLLALYDAGPRKLDAYAKGLGKAGTAAQVAAKLQDNLKGDIEAMTGALETQAIKIGQRLIPMVSDAVVQGTQLLNEYGDEVLTVGDALTSGLGGALTGSVAALAIFAFAASKTIAVVQALRLAIIGINPIVGGLALIVGALTYEFIRGQQETDKYAGALDEAKAKMDALTASANEAKHADVGLATARLNLRSASMGVRDAEAALRDARAGGDRREINRAELNLAQARNGVRQATLNLTDAEQRAAAARKGIRDATAAAKTAARGLADDLWKLRNRYDDLITPERMAALGIDTTQRVASKKDVARFARDMDALAKKANAAAGTLEGTNPRLATTARNAGHAASQMALLSRAWQQVVDLPSLKTFTAHFNRITTIEERRPFGGGARASGGTVLPGRMYRVNERGGEIGVFALGGRILSHSDSKSAVRRALGGGGGGGAGIGPTVVVNVNNPTFLTGDRIARRDFATGVVKEIQLRLRTQPALLSEPRPGR